MSCVYFAEQVGGRLVKIGWTKTCPKRRVRALQTGSPVKIRLAGVIETDDPRLEKELHARFADSRVQGEWFRRSKELMALVPRPPKDPAVVEARRKAKVALANYVADRLRFGVSQGHFTVTDIAKIIRCNAAFLEKLRNDESETHEFLKRRFQALNNAMCAVGAPYPLRRQDDAARSEVLDRRSKRKAGAA